MQPPRVNSHRDLQSLWKPFLQYFAAQLPRHAKFREICAKSMTRWRTCDRWTAVLSPNQLELSAILGDINRHVAFACRKRTVLGCVSRQLMDHQGKRRCALVVNHRICSPDRDSGAPVYGVRAQQNGKEATERAFPNFWGGLRAVRPSELMSAAECCNAAQQ